MSGLSLDGLSAGQVLGFSANPRTIEKFRKELADNHPKFAAEQISKGTNVINTILSLYVALLVLVFKRLHKSQDYKNNRQPYTTLTCNFWEVDKISVNLIKCS